MPKEGLTAIRIFMPEELRDDFKTICTAKKMTMNKAVVDWVEHYVEQNKALLMDRSATLPATFKEFVEVKGGALLKQGGIDPKRIQAFTHGAKPNSRERQIIAQMLNMSLEELPE